jgi:hypothetical protein
MSAVTTRSRAAVELACAALALLLPWVIPSHAMMINEIAITALFALSLDLILGYAGIVSLGHATRWLASCSRCCCRPCWAWCAAPRYCAEVISPA